MHDPKSSSDSKIRRTNPTAMASSVSDTASDDEDYQVAPCSFRRNAHGALEREGFGTAKLRPEKGGEAPA
jgi:hypothetical protein